MTRSWVATAVDCAVVGATKLGISLVVYATGFAAISDDDFSRVVIAQRWALDPTLDPSGTSWLPLPFWLNGAVMTIAGRSLATAQAVALVLGVLAAVLVYGAARLLFEQRRDAYVGALVAAIVPSAAVLGVATVPELPTAALAVVGIASTAGRSARQRMLGAGALLLACLSRYEPWLLAAGFVVVTLRDGWRERLEPAEGARRFGVVAAAVAAAGPLAWMVHNGIAHGNPLHFLTRVATYQRSLEGAAADSWAAALNDALAYPLELLRQEPELGLAMGALIALRAWEARRSGGGISAVVASGARRPLLLLAVMVAGLSAAALGGGAPTHHIGRPLVVAWLMGALFVGAELSRRARELDRRAAAVALGGCAAALVVGALWLRPRVVAAEPFVNRSDQVAIGRAVAEVVPSGARVLLQVVDYGYFAVLAASGRPEAFVVDRSVDPRLAAERSSFASAEALQRRLRQTGVRFLVADRMTSPVLLGNPLRVAGRWALWSAGGALSVP